MRTEPGIPADDLRDVTLAILAGGEGSRMGVPKSHLRIGGERILRYLLKRFDWPGPTLLVTAPGREHPPGWEDFTTEASDPVAGLGPLRGIQTALENATTDDLLVTTVDMPGLTAEQLHWAVRAFRAERSRRDLKPSLVGLMTCRHDGAERRIEPFPAAFHREAGRVIRGQLQSGRRSVHALTQHPGFLAIAAPESWDEGSWVNLNRPEDLEAFVRNVRNVQDARDVRNLESGP